jgi:predicted deacylase
MTVPPFTLGTSTIRPGTRLTVDLPVSVLSNHTPIALPVHVIHGAAPGPVMFISAVVHGDEILGVEIVRRVVRHSTLSSLAGTLLAVPIVNAFGLISHSRYMPDRRDLKSLHARGLAQIALWDRPSHRSASPDQSPPDPHCAR